MEPTLRKAAKGIADVPLFSAEEARAWGISAKDLTILVRRGLILRLDRGWYSTMVAAEPSELHVLRTAAALRMHSGPVAAGHSAVLLHDLPLARADLSTVELARVSDGHGVIRQGVRVRRETGLPNVPVTIPMLGQSARAVDIPSAIVGTALTNNPVAALVAGDGALHSKRCTTQQIDAALAAARGSVGIARARDVLQLLDHRHESAGETLTHWELGRLGWELIPQWEVTLASGRKRRLDLRVKGERVAIEYDGRDKMKLPRAREKLEARQIALEGMGWEFVRVVSEDLDDPVGLHRRVQDAVAASRRAA
ncbi:hypothetical protein JNO54_12585 [Janibacter sp. YIM B02568]|uniref:type IV toxin-antitoxin system AbiEi family antitoxin domain-containing protein n=1 Tax=Janibacter endophyticus TaxID=2806261 RepID=UPI00194DF6CB|nr:type IV toxin-antitoxin system AbiEi family antitoxin domain-containing protein [Janibacter endophyticus]MBM6546968.1 hypothetical protein [Janibacter endophyticus]